MSKYLLKIILLIYPYHRIQLSNAKERTIDIHSNLDGSGGIYADWKKPVFKDYVIYLFLRHLNDILEKTKFKLIMGKGSVAAKG